MHLQRASSAVFELEGAYLGLDHTLGREKERRWVGVVRHSKTTCVSVLKRAKNLFIVLKPRKQLCKCRLHSSVEHSDVVEPQKE